MTIYDYMAPFEDVPENGPKILEKPLLHLATPAASPIKANEFGYDWNQGNDPHWQRNVKPDSPQSLPSLDHSPPNCEHSAKPPKCGTCGLTNKRWCICGHICRDIPEDNFCPDIEAPYSSGEDCATPSPTRKPLLRRRSSLAKPPMLARDESTYGKAEEKQSNTVSAVLNHNQPADDNQSTTSENKVYHVSHDVGGDADWHKHCCVEKAIEQILFGNARVSAHTMPEQTQKLRATSITEGTLTRHDEDELHTEVVAAAQTYTEPSKPRVPTTEEGNLEFETVMAASEEQTRDYVICSDREDEQEDAAAHYYPQDAICESTSSTQVRGWPSDDECSSCCEDLPADTTDLVTAEPSQVRMDTSKA